jgi:glutamate-ammonia-ligase adenylyltransferase
MSSCAASSIASSIWTTSRPTFCQPSDGDLGWIAATLGFASCCPFLSELDRHRELVAQEFDKLLAGAGEQECKGCNGNGKSLPSDFEALLEHLPEALRERIRLWCVHPRVAALRDDARVRLIRLVQRTALWVREGRISEEAAVRLVDWIEPLLRRESYLAMLLERPSVHERLLRLLGSARWPAHYLLQHPGVIDELASDFMLEERFSADDFERELEDRRNAPAPNRRGRRGGSAQPAAPRPPRRKSSERWHATWKVS